MEYLINVGLTFVPEAVILLFLYVLAVQVVQRVDYFKQQDRDIKRTILRPSLYAMLAISLFLAMTTKSITYKNVTFDEQAESRQIEQLNAQKHSKTETLVIKDATKPIEGKTDEEFDDMVEFNNDGRD